MGIGIDMVEVRRIGKIVNQWGDSFLNRVFTANELREWELSGKRLSFLAGRFASKEAFIKATQSKGIKWKQMEILWDSIRKPVLWFNGNKLEGADLSISHTSELAISIVIVPNTGTTDGHR